jgi:DNA-binding response OmpR family regulator
MKVLIVEDNPLLLKSAVFLFKKFNYQIIAAIDGQQGIDFFKSEQPDIVITDLLLPFATGQELIEFIRDHEVKYTKIIALSGMSTQVTRQHIFSLGADDFVEKPFMPADLLMRVQRLEKYMLTKPARV